MKPKLLLCLAPVLSGGLFSFVNGGLCADEMGRAAPAAKDAYVSAQLTKLFAGAPVSVALRRAFDNWLSVDVFAADVKAEGADRLAPKSSVELFAFDNEAAARGKVQEELHFFTSPSASAKAGYDEFYSANGGRLIGRRGAIMVVMYSSPLEGSDSVFAAIANNLAANPALLPDLIHFAHSMHFGDTAPLHAVMAKLNARIPQLSVARLSDKQNSMTADYIDTNGSKLTIIAKSYDSEAAAKGGQEFDQKQIQAGGWNKTEIIEGARVFEDTNYGTIYFQIGLHTFNLTTISDKYGAVRSLLPKVASALIAGLAPPVAGQVDPALSITGLKRDAKQYFKNYLDNCETNGMNCLWFLQSNPKIGMVMTIHLDQGTVFTERDVYNWAHQNSGTRRLTHPQVRTLKEIITNLPASNTNAGFNDSVFVSVRNAGKVEVFHSHPTEDPKKVLA
jgi:hypothetical protein